MKTVQLKIGKRTFALAFTLDAMCMMQETLPDFDLATISDRVKTPDGLLDIITIMAQQGELLEGRTLDVDRAWFGSHISPAPLRIAKIQITVLNALAEGLRMETEEDSPEETDEVLEEIKKKEATGG
ncbi:MAG: hypothetical protein IJ523_06705 [Succinivibrionaceae bacterium]|nr:hypothetical protein [Succinivibrionaceae bacterium]